MSREAGLTDSKLTSHQVTIACHNELLSPFALDRLDVAFLTDHEEFHKVKIQLQEVEASRLISEISLISSVFCCRYFASSEGFLPDLHQELNSPRILISNLGGGCPL